MSKKSENYLAVGGLTVGLALALAFALYWRWSEAAFWSVAGGFTAFYGFGCFRVWYMEHPTDKQRAERHAIWFIHMYWMNALACLVGWGAARLLYARYDNSVGWGVPDLLLFLTAFLGLVGWLPYAVIGLAVAIRNLAEKALELARPQG